jgi:hypothetical protein
MTISVWCHSALKITDIFQNSKMVLRPVLVILSLRQDKNIAAPVKLKIVPVSKLMLKSRIFQMLNDEKTYCPDIEIRFHFPFGIKVEKGQNDRFVPCQLGDLNFQLLVTSPTL